MGYPLLISVSLENICGPPSIIFKILFVVVSPSVCKTKYFAHASPGPNLNDPLDESALAL